MKVMIVHEVEELSGSFFSIFWGGGCFLFMASPGPFSTH